MAGMFRREIRKKKIFLSDTRRHYPTLSDTSRHATGARLTISAGGASVHASQQHRVGRCCVAALIWERRPNGSAPRSALHPDTRVGVRIPNSPTPLWTLDFGLWTFAPPPRKK